MSSNSFALLDVDGQTDQPQKKVAQKKVADKKPAAAAPAPKKDAKIAPKTIEKKPLASGERDRHTKGGRSEGEKTKRPFDRSLNRQTAGQTERKGQDKQIKGGWAQKNPEADQVAPDVDQKKDEAEAKIEEAEAKVEVPAKPEEPAPFLLADALKAKQKVAGERTKTRAATAAADSKAINQGSKPSNTVQPIQKTQSQINKNKKTFNIDEFHAVNGGAEKSFPEERQQRKRAPKVEFPAL